MFLSDEFPSLAAGDRVSVDWGGTDTSVLNEQWGLAITGGVVTYHYTDITQLNGFTITADGIALGLFSDMRSSTTPKTLSNLRLSGPVPSGTIIFIQ